MPKKSSDKDIIRQTLLTINKAWSKGNPDDLNGQIFQESEHDMFVFNREDEK
jgi:hypothetical protein